MNVLVVAVERCRIGRLVLCGQTREALDHLRRAVEMSDEFGQSAEHASDLDPIRDEPAFQQLINHY